jgi:hypothetical protein
MAIEPVGVTTTTIEDTGLGRRLSYTAIVLVVIALAVVYLRKGKK